MQMVESVTSARAANVRSMPRKQTPVRVVTISSGKGGVGKTNVSVNLAMALSNAGKRVTIMDADLGLGNIDVLLGLHPQYNLNHVIEGERELDEIIEHGPGNLSIIPAASGVQNMAELSPAQHAGLIRAFSGMSHDLDVLLVDTAAGISDSVISFSRAAQDVLVVVNDEPASITDAYALIKVLNREHGLFRFRILCNRVKSAQQGRELYSTIVKVTDRFLDVALDYVGFIPDDDFVVKAIRKQRPVVDAYPRSRASMAFKTLAEKMNKWPIPTSAGGHLEFFVERLVQGNMTDAEVMP
ncbi:MAG TPA: MinD/ParA family protein [Gammaproteobacteria bacterium]|nr:MinD/ParA family protein [Gammaproteobacteria bacterium]